jgi:hypothetical protein
MVKHYRNDPPAPEWWPAMAWSGRCDDPITGLNSKSIEIFANVYSEFYGRPPAYTRKALWDITGAAKRVEVSDSSDDWYWGDREKNTGFRFATDAEARFAEFGFDPELKESGRSPNTYVGTFGYEGGSFSLAATL